MRRVVLLLLLVTVLVASCHAQRHEEIEDLCTSFFTSMLTPRCYGPCPERKMGIEQMHQFLEKHIFGQEYALNITTSAIEHMTMDAPLVLHFAGDNGAGKTYTSKLIGEVLFSVKDARSGLYKGVLQFRGNQFTLNANTQELYPEKVEEFKSDIRRRVVRQLNRCPRSLIVFDEAELPSPEVMQVFEELIDGDHIEFESITASSNEAIFIFISDFGMEGITEGMTMDEVVERISQDMRNVWMYGKQETMVTHVVPFNNMYSSTSTRTPEAVVLQVYSFIRYLPESLPIKLQKSGISIGRLMLYIPGRDKCETEEEDHYEAIQMIADFIYEEVSSSETYRHRNYRGIKQYFNLHVLPHISMAFEEKHANKHMPVARVGINIEKTDQGIRSFTVISAV